jgi:hypothetical protein
MRGLADQILVRLFYAAIFGIGGFLGTYALWYMYLMFWWANFGGPDIPVAKIAPFVAAALAVGGFFIKEAALPGQPR